MKDVIFTPLAIPPIPEKQKVLDRFNAPDFYVWWDEETLLGEKENNNPLGRPQKWTENAKNNYPELIDWVETYIPCDEWYYIRIARAKEEIPPHVDGNSVNPTHKHHLAILPEALEYNMEHEPIGYRFVIAGSMDKMYMCKEHDYTRNMTWQDKHMCIVPDDTDAFVIRNQDQAHGVEADTDDRLIGFILGKVNAKKHWDLIEKSVSTYSDNVIRKQDVFNA